MSDMSQPEPKQTESASLTADDRLSLINVTTAFAAPLVQRSAAFRAAVLDTLSVFLLDPAPPKMPALVDKYITAIADNLPAILQMVAPEPQHVITMDPRPTSMAVFGWCLTHVSDADLAQQMIAFLIDTETNPDVQRTMRAIWSKRSQTPSS